MFGIFTMKRRLKEQDDLIKSQIRTIGAQRSCITHLENENTRLKWQVENPPKHTGHSLYMYDKGGELECYHIVERTCKLNTHFLVDVLPVALMEALNEMGTLRQRGKKTEKAQKVKSSHPPYYWHYCLIARGEKDFTKCFWVKEQDIPNQKKIAPF